MTHQDPELEYLAGLRHLLREEAPYDPVKQVIRARLEGVREPVQGLISPPLGRDDAGPSLLLLYLYDELRFDRDEPAKERLRRAATELLEEALTGGADYREINRLGRLVGAFEVRRSEPLAGRLRTWLWGYLEIGLPRPGEALIELPDDDLIRARQVLDLWLAVTPALPSGWPEHYAGKLGSFFDENFERGRGKRFNWNRARFQLLTLLYRGLLDLDPEYAGKNYPILCKLAHDIRERDTEGIWLSLCWEYGVLLGANEKWRRRFAQGLTRIGEDEKRNYKNRSGSDLNTLFWHGLELLDHLDVDLKRYLYPPEPATQGAKLEHTHLPHLTKLAA